MLFVTAILVVFQTARTQPHYFTHFQVEDGLSNNAVICSMQDRKGFLWFGTKDGLNRFDGYSFKIYRHDEVDSGSIGSNFIHCLYEDRGGTLWVGTDQGIFSYNALNETFSRLKHTPFSEIRDISEDADGNLWFIADLILYRFNKRTRQLIPYSPDHYFRATSLCLTSENQLWIATPEGDIKKYHAREDSFSSVNVFAHSPRAVSNWIEKLYNAGDHLLWIGTSNQGVKLFNTETGRYRDILTHNKNNTTFFARDFIRYDQDTYWIATESGIIIYHMKTGKYEILEKQFNNPYSVSDNAVYTFCKDKEGGVWSGTYFGGLNYYTRAYGFFKKYFPKAGENSLSGNAVREICPDGYGNLWIGTEDGGLSRLDPQREHFTSFRPDGTRTGISNINIHGLLITGDTLWIGTFEHGLDLMNVSTGKVIRHFAAGPAPFDLKSNFVYCIYRTRDGKVILGTTNGLYSYNARDGHFVNISLIPAYFYTTIYEDSEGTIWAGTYRNGLYFFNPGTGQTGSYRYDPENDHSISNNRINDIYEDSNGQMWVATEGGVCRLLRHEKAFKRFTIKNGLPGNLVYSILEDDDRHLWMSTSKGLVRLSLATEKMIVFTKANGLLSDQFNYNSAYRDSSGRMYFGCVKGLISFDPDAFDKSHYSPPVYITGFQIYNNEQAIGRKGSPLKKSIIFTDSIRLRHNQSTFSIDFAALGYRSPQMTEYAYQLEGLDPEWVYLKTNRKVFFTKLSPGSYVFKVKAAVNNREWNPREARLVIEILPPFWKSPTAYLLYTLLFLTGVLLSVRRYHQRIKEKNNRKLAFLQNEKEKEIYQAKIEFFTHVAHEIRTPLTLIKGPMEKVIALSGAVPQISSNLKIMARNTDRLLKLTNQLLDFRKTESNGFSLNFVKTDVSLLLKDLFLRFKPAAEQRQISFTLNLFSSAFFAYVDNEAFNKILSNLTDNAIKYAGSRAEICLLPVNEGDQTFVIEIKNDGDLIPPELREAVFEVFFRIKPQGKQSGSGIGLPLAHSLTELHQGRLVLEDCENEFNTFVLTLPIHHEIEFNPVMSR